MSKRIRWLSISTSTLLQRRVAQPSTHGTRFAILDIIIVSQYRLLHTCNLELAIRFLPLMKDAERKEFALGICGKAFILFKSGYWYLATPRCLY
jgi:hypothetical protein